MFQLHAFSTRFLTTLWAAGTVLGSTVSIASWIYNFGGPLRAAANLGYMLSLPGWIPLYAMGLRGIRDHPLGIIAANAIAWCFWCILVAAVLRIHARWTTNTPDRSEEMVQNPGRRAFMAHGVLGVGAVGAVVSPTYATLIEPWSVKIRRYRIPIADLPDAFEGLRVVQFSDPHLGPRVPASFYRSAVEQVAALKPDLLVLTGDYIHDGVAEIELAASLCSSMIDAASIGAVGVLGNHDWWGDGLRMAEQMRQHGVRMIDNDRIWIDPETRSLVNAGKPGALAVVGLGDLTEDVIDTKRAFSGIDSATPRIVLAHQPDTAELPELTRPGSPRVDLMCSGHTHGGQVRLPLLGTPLVPSRFGSKYAGGLVQGPRFPVVVSRGIGMSLLPVRFGVPPEIVEMTLTRA